MLLFNKTCTIRVSLLFLWRYKFWKFLCRQILHLLFIFFFFQDLRDNIHDRDNLEREHKTTQKKGANEQFVDNDGKSGRFIGCWPTCRRFCSNFLDKPSSKDTPCQFESSWLTFSGQCFFNRWKLLKSIDRRSKDHLEKIGFLSFFSFFLFRFSFE